MSVRLITNRDNGGPPLDDHNLVFGEKFLHLFTPARHKAFFGGRGSGKSHAVATYLVIVSSQSCKRIVCARQFQNSIADSSKTLIEIKIKELGLSDQFRITDREIVHIYTQSRFTFIGLDRNPDSAKSLEGADICWIEEARTINARSMEILIPTIRKPGSELIWTWNPEKPDDPVDDYFRGNHNVPGRKFVAPPNSIICDVGIEDNPWFYHTTLPQEMWHMEAGNHTRFLHVWKGGYDESYETKVFTNIIHGRLPITEYMAPRYGIDFGFGQDPFAIVKLYVNNLTRQIYIARTASGRFPLRDLPLVIDSVIESRDDLIRADPSGAIEIDHLQSQGFNVIKAHKPAGSVKSGISWLQGYQIWIDPDCEDMREEARLYSWQVDKLTRKVLSVPVDAHNHLWDSVRYATESDQTEPDVPPQDGGVINVRR